MRGAALRFVVRFVVLALVFFLAATVDFFAVFVAAFLPLATVFLAFVVAFFFAAFLGFALATVFLAFAFAAFFFFAFLGGTVAYLLPWTFGASTRCLVQG